MKAKAITVMVAAQCTRCNQESNVPVKRIGTSEGIHMGCTGFLPEVKRAYDSAKLNIRGVKGVWAKHWLLGVKPILATSIPSFEMG